jgi:hypothetical protein
MAAGPRRQVDVTRLMADLSALKIEMLSAQCSMDRVRLQYSAQDIVVFGDRQALKRVIASADAMQEFVAQIRAQLQLHAGEDPAQ